MEPFKLTEFSPGAGCGCKISPEILDQILKSPTLNRPLFPDLLVGNESKDDAAVLDIGGGRSLVSTTDFFMPIVDDPFEFGRIASTNAISDVYAMGAKPILALAILGWPVSKLGPEMASQVLEGARSICLEAGIPLAGGHSIDCPEPIFGLSVNGILPSSNIKRNNTAKPGSLLYLTKRLGVGILSTAQKKGLIRSEDLAEGIKSMTTLNKLGEKLGGIPYVEALTDITGFGLLGHLLEICQGSGVFAEIYMDKIPVFDSIPKYLIQDCIPGGTHRNWSSYGSKISPISDTQKYILADPQTSGGLLIVISENKSEEFEHFFLSEEGSIPSLIGRILEKNNANIITVSNPYPIH